MSSGSFDLTFHLVREGGVLTGFALKAGERKGAKEFCEMLPRALANNMATVEVLRARSPNKRLIRVSYRNNSLFGFSGRQCSFEIDRAVAEQIRTMITANMRASASRIGLTPCVIMQKAGSRGTMEKQGIKPCTSNCP